MAMTNREDVHSGKTKRCILTALVCATFFATADSSPITRQVGISENVFITVQNDTYGNEQRVCSIDNMTFEDGDSIPTSSPCEHCICRPPGFACTIISCEYKPGCKAIKRSNQCCPEYQCECEKDGKIYQNGEKILDNENPCEVCYCQGGDVVCAVIDCYWRSDCQPRYIENRCCPLYDHCPPTQNHQGPLHRLTTSTTTQVPFPSSWFNISMGAVTTPKVPEVPVITSTTSTTTESTTTENTSTESTTTTTTPTTTTSTSTSTTTTEEPLSNDIEEYKPESIAQAPAVSSESQVPVEATSEHAPVTAESVQQVEEKEEQSSDIPIVAPSVTEIGIPEHLMSFTTWEPEIPQAESTTINSEFAIVPTLSTSEVVQPTIVDQTTTTQVASTIPLDTTQALEPTTVIEGTTIIETDLVASTEVPVIPIPSAIPTPELSTSETSFVIPSVPAADQITPTSVITPQVTEQQTYVAGVVTAEPVPETTTGINEVADKTAIDYQTSVQTQNAHVPEDIIEPEKAGVQEESVSAELDKTPVTKAPITESETEKVLEVQVSTEAEPAVSESEVENAPANDAVPVNTESNQYVTTVKPETLGEAPEIPEVQTTVVPKSVVVTSTEVNMPAQSMNLEPETVADDAVVTESVTKAAVNYIDDIATVPSIPEVLDQELGKVEVGVADEAVPATTVPPIVTVPEVEDLQVEDDIRTTVATAPVGDAEEVVMQKEPEIPSNDVVEETTMKQTVPAEPEVEIEQHDAADEETTTASVAPVEPQEVQAAEKVSGGKDAEENPVAKPTELMSEKDAAADKSVIDALEQTTERVPSDIQQDFAAEVAIDEAAEPTTEKVQPNFPENVITEATEIVESDSVSTETIQTTVVPVQQDVPEEDVSVQSEQVNEVQQSQTEASASVNYEPLAGDEVAESDSQFVATTFAPVSADEAEPQDAVTVATPETEPIKKELPSQDAIAAVTDSSAVAEEPAVAATVIESLPVKHEAEPTKSHDEYVTEKVMQSNVETEQDNEQPEVQDSTVVYTNSNDEASDDVDPQTTLRSEVETAALVIPSDESGPSKVEQASAENTLKLRLDLDPSMFADSAESFVKSAENIIETAESAAKPHKESTSLPEILDTRDSQKTVEIETAPLLPEAEALKDEISGVVSVTAVVIDDTEAPTNAPSLLRHHTAEHTHEQKLEAELLAVQGTTMPPQFERSDEAVNLQNAPSSNLHEVSLNTFPETTLRGELSADEVETSTISVVADEVAGSVEHVTTSKVPVTNHSQEEAVKTEDSLVVPMGSLPKETVKKIDPFSEDLGPAGRSDLNLEDHMKSEISSADDSWYWRAMNRVRNLANIFPTVRSRSSRG